MILRAPAAPCHVPDAKPSIARLAGRRAGLRRYAGDVASTFAPGRPRVRGGLVPGPSRRSYQPAVADVARGGIDEQRARATAGNRHSPRQARVRKSTGAVLAEPKG